MAAAPDRLNELARATVEGLGYEFVGVEYHSGSGAGGGVLRVYIDRPEGISVDDCARVSHQFSGVLDVEDPIRENYSLEISSPGLDRPLFTLEQFQRYVGSQVSIRLRGKLHERRRFKGLLQAVEAQQLVVVVDGEAFHLPLAEVDRARLVPEG